MTAAEVDAVQALNALAVQRDTAAAVSAQLGQQYRARREENERQAVAWRHASEDERQAAAVLAWSADYGFGDDSAAVQTMTGQELLAQVRRNFRSAAAADKPAAADPEAPRTSSRLASKAAARQTTLLAGGVCKTVRGPKQECGQRFRPFRNRLCKP